MKYLLKLLIFECNSDDMLGVLSDYLSDLEVDIAYKI
jgi:hypothetical protein